MGEDSPAELVLRTGAAANGGSCVARHEGRVVFVRYALPDELVRVRVTGDRESYWHAETLEVLEPSPHRIDSLCSIAGVDGAGCCDLAFADPAFVRELKGQVVANQLARLGDYTWAGLAEPVGDGAARGWRTRVRLAVGADGRAGFHRYHSSELVTELRCGQLPDGMLDGLDGPRWRPGDQVHVVLGDDGTRHVVCTNRQQRRGHSVEGGYDAVQRVGQREWRVPATGFWQSHRDAAATYSAVVAGWSKDIGATTAWDLYGGAGLFAAVLAEAVGESGRVLTVDTSRAASRAATAALADLPQVDVVTDSVRRALGAQRGPADIAVLDPPRSGAGREVVDLLAEAGVPRVIHVGCEAAAFARDVGLYQRRGYTVEQIRVFDSFPLTHHIECIALLTR
ncbi:class I SAM-dependent RNA methyltransferase [Mycolicibacterium sp. CH28]|uniref:class I SAM-dependent RNA methyltransferase n=1 Tax=Mycolicibacterium sp. CH28 TaxID=2512237 RepID=UPI001080EB6A|nr:TRAM domain-containing protein [Mycolicibacterium sp. CH28]TGD86509.1 class I SAM-dependent RNA methyltransferase [Mycolicibacterium sp. CH28]